MFTLDTHTPFLAPPVLNSNPNFVSGNKILYSYVSCTTIGLSSSSSSDLLSSRIFNIEEKANDNKEEDDEEEYKENNDDYDDESSDNEEEDREEEDSEEENNDETESEHTLCCAGDLCKQQEGYIIIGEGHQCAVCEGRMHDFLCSDGKVETMVGMTCKNCDNNNREKNADD